MGHKKFKLWHSLLMTVALLAAEGMLVFLVPLQGMSAWIVLGVAVGDSILAIYIATQIIEDVRNTLDMLVLLSVAVLEFVVFFAFQYWYLLLLQAASFPTLSADPTTLLLHSTMVFVFNPLYLPATGFGRALLLINTLSAVGLVVFILQNMGQIRSKTSA